MNPVKFSSLYLQKYFSPHLWEINVQLKMSTRKFNLNKFIFFFFSFKEGDLCTTFEYYSNGRNKKKIKASIY